MRLSSYPAATAPAAINAPASVANTRRRRQLGHSGTDSSAGKNQLAFMLCRSTGASLNLAAIRRKIYINFLPDSKDSFELPLPISL
jgi:hypothetical protein